MLGNNGYNYYVYSNGIIQSERLDGKKLGNVLYGAVCSDSGKKYESAMKYAGAELLKEAKSWGDAVLCELGAVSYCDDDIGLDYTYLGYKVAETRGYKVAWDFDVKSPYT